MVILCPIFMLIFVLARKEQNEDRQMIAMKKTLYSKEKYFYGQTVWKKL